MTLRATSTSSTRRRLNCVRRPLHAVWQFGHWVRHSQADTEAIYGRNPNQLTEQERLVKAALILHGTGGGGGQQSGF